MIKRQIVSAVALVTLGLGAAGTASAEVMPGWYFGVSAGQSQIDIDKNEIDLVVRSALISQAAPILSGSSRVDDEDTSLALLAGFRLNPYIAFEAGYTDFGAAEYMWRGVVNPPGPVTAAPATLGLDFETSGLTIAAVGSAPIGDMFELHGRLGGLFAKTEVDIVSTVGSGVGTGNVSSTTQEIFYGVGAAFHIGNHWSLSLDWQQFKDVGDDEETDEADVDTIALSVIFRI